MAAETRGVKRRAETDPLTVGIFLQRDMERVNCAHSIYRNVHLLARNRVSKGTDVDGLLELFLFPFGLYTFREYTLEDYLDTVFCAFHDDNGDYNVTMEPSKAEHEELRKQVYPAAQVIKKMLIGDGCGKAPMYKMLCERPEGKSGVVVVLPETTDETPEQAIVRVAACSMAREASVYGLFKDPQDYTKFAESARKVLIVTYITASIVQKLLFPLPSTL